MTVSMAWMTPSLVRMSSSVTRARPLPVLTPTLSLKMSLMSRVTRMVSPEAEVRLVSPAGILTACSSTTWRSRTEVKMVQSAFCDNDVNSVGKRKMRGSHF